MMSEFSFDRVSDWDLQAIVKGTTNTMNMILPSSSNDAWFESLGLEEDYQAHENTTFIFNNNNNVESNYDYHGSSSNSIQKIVDTSMINFDVYTQSSLDEPKQKSTNVLCESSTRASISKRRKNKHKIIKMVQQIGGDRVLTDKWNWRKYGEKVIKGSPYPRSYYRCSYSGGCSARKQVEQSSKDPGLFLITYMEEHTHPYPTRRHSQAGRSARRFTSFSSSSSSTNKVVKTTNELQNTLVRTMTSESSTNNSNDRTLVLQGDEDDNGSAEYVGGDNNSFQGDVCFRNRVFEDDFFAGLDYLEGLSMNLYN